MENLKVFINKYHYNELDCHFLCKFFLGLVLGFASFFYGAAIKVKNFLYTAQILKEEKVDAFVICVGNLTTGGVGKTPIVCDIANFCTNTLKKKAVVISRGYGAKLSSKNINVITDGKTINYTDGSICGDEALLICQNTQNCPVITCSDRVRAAKDSIENFGAQIIILDDGFSNRKIFKNLTILALDLKKQLGNKKLLPLGPLREPIYEAKRADFSIIVNKNNPAFEPDRAAKLFNLPYNACTMLPDKFYNIATGEPFLQKDKSVGAFCAIGQPEQFYNYLDNLVFTKSFADHYAYTKKDIDELIFLAKQNGIKTLITTQKDEVKIRPLLDKNELLKSEEIDFITMTLALKHDSGKLYDFIKDEIKKYETE